MKIFFLAPLISLSSLHGVMYVDLNLSDQSNNPNNPSFLQSVEFNGLTLENPITPSSFQNVSLTGDVLARENSSIVSTLGDSGFTNAASDVFASTNINAFLQLDDNTFGETYQVNFDGGSALMPGYDYVVVITERGLNNSTRLEAFGNSNNSLGSRDILADDYADTGIQSLIKPEQFDLNQNIGYTSFLLSDLVDLSGDTVTNFQFTNTDDDTDGADNGIYLFKVIPEPSTALLLALSGLALGRRKR